jgi:hypothetical protein
MCTGLSPYARPNGRYQGGHLDGASSDRHRCNQLGEAACAFDLVDNPSSLKVLMTV